VIEIRTPPVATPYCKVPSGLLLISVLDERCHKHMGHRVTSKSDRSRPQVVFKLAAPLREVDESARESKVSVVVTQGDAACGLIGKDERTN
jgi:hypothetical protein